MSDDFKKKLIDEMIVNQNCGKYEEKLTKWIPLVNSKCPKCDKETLERSIHFLGGSYSGGVRCTECSYRNSFVSYVGHMSIKVEPLPPVALAYSDKSPKCNCGEDDDKSGPSIPHKTDCSKLDE